MILPRILPDNAWTFGHWGADNILKLQPSIEFLELYALCLAIYSWNYHKKL